MSLDKYGRQKPMNAYGNQDNKSNSNRYARGGLTQSEDGTMGHKWGGGLCMECVRQCENAWRDQCSPCQGCHSYHPGGNCNCTQSCMDWLGDTCISYQYCCGCSLPPPNCSYCWSWNDGGGGGGGGYTGGCTGTTAGGTGRENRKGGPIRRKRTGGQLINQTRRTKPRPNREVTCLAKGDVVNINGQYVMDLRHCFGFDCTELSESQVEAWVSSCSCNNGWGNNWPCGNLACGQYFVNNYTEASETLYCDGPPVDRTGGTSKRRGGKIRRRR